jgi:carbamoyl-phosphate synthase / aspartate carbamoyltransferase / dihydroorotase
MIKLPGLIDPHVHLREPGATHKEDYDSGTASALAGGVTMVLAMPNTKPPIFDETSLDDVLATASAKARCDYAQYLGAGPDNAAEVARIAPKAAALKMYLDSTFGQLRLDDMTLWLEHFRHWPGQTPIVVHAESRSMAAAIWLAQMFDKPIHIAHISLREEILLIKEAKQRGIKVTCEVCPHHLFLDLVGAQQCCAPTPGRIEVRPRLSTKADVDALWENMAFIDCFATDHAPHTLSEKDSDNPPPGFPGLETLLPLLLTAVSESRLTINDIIQKSVINPRKIFNLPEQPETWVEVDENAKYEIKAAEMHSRCGWTPFEGWQVRGRITRVVLRGEEAYRDGKILARPGTGRNVRA